MKRKFLVVIGLVLIITSACVISGNNSNSGTESIEDKITVEIDTLDEPPYLGVFLHDKGGLVPIDKFSGPPEFKPSVSTDITNLTFSVWLDNFVADNFVLISYRGNDDTKNKIDFNLKPIQPDGAFEVVLTSLPEPDVYCFVLGNILYNPYEIPNYCFEYDPLANVAPTPTVYVKPEWIPYESIRDFKWDREGNYLALLQFHEYVPSSSSLPIERWYEIIIYDPNTKKEISRLKKTDISANAYNDFEWTPVGNIAVVENATIHIWEIGSENFRDDISYVDYPWRVSDIDYSRDGNLLALTLKNYRNSSVNILNLDTSEFYWYREFQAPNDVKFSPDSQSIYVVDFNHDDTENNVFSVQNDEEALSSLIFRSLGAAWNPNGNSIAICYAWNEDKVQIWSSDLSKLIKEISAPVDCRSLDWSPDGNKIAIAGDSFVEQPNFGKIVDLTTDLSIDFKQYGSKVKMIKFSPDGTEIYLLLATGDIMYFPTSAFFN